MAGVAIEPLLFQCRRCALRSVRRTPAAIRPLSSTVNRAATGSVPEFSETANPELDDILAKARSKIFLPAYLKRAQRDLVYRTRHHAMLRSEPFVVNVYDEDFELVPIDKTKDVPNSWKTIRQTLLLMGSSDTDKANFINLLRGMTAAGREWLPWRWCLMIKLIGEKGIPDILIEAAQQGPKTGLLLHRSDIVRAVMWAFRQKGYAAAWSEEETAKALRYAELAGELLDDDKHAGALKKDQPDPRTDPGVIGAVLELAAIRATRHASGKDDGGKVEAYVQRLLPNLEAGPETPDEQDVYRIARLDAELQGWTPVWNGLRLAATVLDEDTALGREAKQKAGELKPWLDSARETIASSPITTERRGRTWFEDADKT